MNMKYETERLILKILPETAAKQVLQFYLENKELFERYESERPKQFYTEEFQRIILRGEYNLAVRQSSIRFWVFEKGRPERIVGTVSLQNIRRNAYQTCELGYKFHQQFWKRGYARESISKCIQIVFGELKLHRIEANVQPENEASRRLLLDLGFQLEGIKRQSVKLQGGWTDHEVYALLKGEEAILPDNGTNIQYVRC